jgi:DNA-directed RNA polymerase subunit RPC12/RpoP
MNLLNFVTSYPDETSCRKKFKEIREKEGVVCPKCEAKSITGKRIRNVTNASSAIPGRVCEPIP